jgi:hypothetical protein
VLDPLHSDLNPFLDLNLNLNLDLNLNLNLNLNLIYCLPGSSSVPPWLTIPGWRLP